MKRPELSAGLAGIAAHIRANLGEPIMLGKLAALAGFSPYHFDRVFRAVFGEPLGAYVRRERLQRAAAALRSGARDVTAIALDAGYESPSAFTRAFSEYFGAPPTDFRADASVPIVPAHALPRFLSRDMTFRVVELRPLRLLAVRRTGNYRTAAPVAFAAIWRLDGTGCVLTWATDGDGQSERRRTERTSGLAPGRCPGPQDSLQSGHDARRGTVTRSDSWAHRIRRCSPPR